MELIADGLLIATGLTATLYCVILSRRLHRLTDAESGIGTQIRSLNKALEETRAALSETRRGVAEARGSARSAMDALSREVALARETLTALERAQQHANLREEREAAGFAPINGQPAGSDIDGGSEEGTHLCRNEDDKDDEIPDWPDGVVPSPDEEAVTSEPLQVSGSPSSAAGSSGLLRVERVSF